MNYLGTEEVTAQGSHQVREEGTRITKSKKGSEEQKCADSQKTFLGPVTGTKGTLEPLHFPLVFVNKYCGMQENHKHREYDRLECL